ncbi:GNAT family N-acetyltransferase [Telluribacter sp. SYSU D00476]|uniref:GNAT family N-acetyltransferase n=1 Tax=Telluribacter sp. SYSU D00476 TaxID=2811430 RepID=UPI001FF19025|nr:GNAT family N-acetyltransferase [Telluribacter sp. SYSU D00476]
MNNSYTYQDQLESERLYTRFLVPEDAMAWAEFFEDTEAVAYLPDFCLDTAEEKAQYWINRQLGRYRENRYGLQALVHKQTGELIGQCGLLLQEVDGQTELEVGYHILPRYWGQGYAPEAARLFIDYAFEQGLAPSIISIIDIRNIKSQRVAEKNGLIREKQTRWADRDVYVYRLMK